MRITEEQRRITEQRIRAAMDRLLRGELPSGGKCDVKTLAAEAGISRNALYTTYGALKTEFEQRGDRLRDAGEIADPREAQIDRLKQQVTELKGRVQEQDEELVKLRAFKTLAVSRIAAQHEELERLRRQLSQSSKVRQLRPTPGE